MRRRYFLPLVVLAPIILASACTDEPKVPEVHARPADLRATLDVLASFGEKRAGSSGGRAAGSYLRSRFERAGLEVSEESFHFPSWELSSASFSLVGLETPPPRFEVLYGSGVGSASGEIVDLGSGREGELAGRDLTGKIGLVRRNQTIHRSDQAEAIAARGGIGMIFVSSAPENLIQIGTVRRDFEPMAKIPAVTVGALDGEALAERAKSGLVGRIKVDARIVVGTGTNVVARVGPKGTPTVVVGAHFDSWNAGSVDNGSGVAALVSLAERWSREKLEGSSAVFAAYDAEEIGLFGGYDFLRRHLVRDREPIVATLHFEMPAAKDSTSQLVGHSAMAEFEESLRDAKLDTVYRGYFDMGLVSAFLGGTIPTDVRGLYRAGIPSVLATMGSAYYHTIKDTPDQVDVDFLADAVDAFDRALRGLMRRGTSCCAGNDEDLFRLTGKVEPRADGSLVAVCDVTDASGAPKSGAAVEALLYRDDFFLVGNVRGKTDEHGRAELRLPNDAAASRGDRTFLHLTAGLDYPLAETVLLVP